MKFRTELHLGKSDISISYSDKILMLGSCFAENIGDKLKQVKYQTTINPLGIIYHPLPLHRSIIDAIQSKRIDQSHLNKNMDGQYTAWNIHSRLSSLDQDETIRQMNIGVDKLNKVIREANYIILTYGTAYYYDHKAYGAVANCHKFPSTDFTKRLSTSDELVDSFGDMISEVKKVNPSVKVLLTVSPVRHIKDGIIENNRSKAHLLTAVHEICDRYEYCSYLPSYELLMDDLRDYRYYADDMVHPSNQAVEYLWSKISEYILDKEESKLRSDILKIIRASTHRPFNPESEKHKGFLESQANAVRTIQEEHPYLDFKSEMEVFEK